MIVLDTHVFVWYALGHANLDKRLMKRMENEPAKVLVPSICVWETMMLVEKGRLVLHGNSPGATLRGFIERAGFAEAPLTGEIAVLSRTLEFHHDDPADRFVAATSYAVGAELATSDERLRRLKWLRLAY